MTSLASSASVIPSQELRGALPLVSQSSFSGGPFLATLYYFLHVLIFLCLFLSSFKFFYLLETLTHIINVFPDSLHTALFIISRLCLDKA